MNSRAMMRWRCLTLASTRTIDDGHPLMRRLAAQLLIVTAIAFRCGADCTIGLLASAQCAPETRTVDMGFPSARGNLVSGWSADEVTSGGVPVVRATSASSVLAFNRYSSRDVRLRFRAKAGEGATEMVETLLNGVSIGATTLRSDFSINELTMPAGSLLPGRNLLEFRYGAPAGAMWDWVELVEPGSRPHRRESRMEGSSLTIPFRSALVFDVDVEPGMELAIDRVDIEGRIDTTDRGMVVITMTSDGGPDLPPLIEYPDGRAVRVAVPVVRRTRLMLRFTVFAPPDGAPMATAVRFSNPRIARRGDCGR